MSRAEVVRRVLFICGVAATALSLALVVGNFLRPVSIRSPMKEALDAQPWVHWGMGSAAVGLVLSCFGQGRWRMVCVAVAGILLAWWIGSGMAV